MASALGRCWLGRNRFVCLKDLAANRQSNRQIVLPRLWLRYGADPYHRCDARGNRLVIRSKTTHQLCQLRCLTMLRLGEFDKVMLEYTLNEGSGRSSAIEHDRWPYRLDFDGFHARQVFELRSLSLVHVRRK